MSHRSGPVSAVAPTATHATLAKKSEAQASKAVDAVSARVHAALHGNGQPLDPATRASMETRFSHDFTRVRVHTDESSADAARAVNAQAFTMGQHVVFASGRYAPHTTGGTRLLAHELTHTLQQRSVPPIGSAPLRVTAPDDSHEIEADHVASLVTTSSAQMLGSVDVSPAPAVAVQRQPASDEELSEESPARDVASRTLASPAGPPSIVMIVATPDAKSSAVATLSNGRVEPVTIDKNTLKPGEYTFQLDASAALHYRLVGRTEGQEFVWRRNRTYAWGNTVRVFIRPSAEERIRDLPPHIRNFLTTTRSGAPKASASDATSIASAGRILETYGVSEDELSLLELAEADRRGVGGAQESGANGDPVGWALAFVEGRQAQTVAAATTRDSLKQSAAALDSAWHWREKPEAAEFERALEVEVRAVATAILNAIEAAIYRMDQRYIGDYQPTALGQGFLSDQLDRLRGDKEIQRARAELQREEAWEPPRAPDPAQEIALKQQAEEYYREGRPSAIPDPYYSQEHVRRHAMRLRADRDELNELVRVKTGSGLQLGSLPHADADQLLGQKSGSKAQSALRDMLFHGRVAVKDARGRLENAKALFGADIVIATEKLLLGVKPGSALDQIIDDIVRERTAPSVWDTILQVASIVAMFIPGGFGVVVRAALATVQSVRSVERFTELSTLNRAGLSTVEPSGNLLAAELIITAGGVVLDKLAAAKLPGRGKLLDLAEDAPVPHGNLPDAVPPAGGTPPPDPHIVPPGGRPEAPTEMRGVQQSDEAHSIQVRGAEAPVPATAQELTALRNTEVSVLGRRGNLADKLERLRIEREGLDGAGGLRGQLAKRDELLNAGTLSKAGRDETQRGIKALEDALDAKDAQIAKLEGELSSADEELAHVRDRLRNEGVVPAVQPPQLAQGVLREAEVGEAFGLGARNTQRMRDPNAGGADFIPDFVDGHPARLSWGKQYHFHEVKDWSKMSDTGNLSAMLDYVATNNGSRLTIYFRSNTAMSGPLATRVDALVKSGRVNLMPFAGL
jgi:hypothetical protein